MTLQELYEHREEVRTALRNKAVELSLDTHKADVVLGVGREIRILDELIKEKLSKKDYQQFIETNIDNL
tara:strand:+ start:2168 stop:2374 length:207 start_codon:yes stop_codon:yes gene_type:complete